MNMDYFYYPELTAADSSLELVDSEARHIASARRLKVNDCICLFNGKGLVAEVQISDVQKHRLTVSVTKSRQEQPVKQRLILATAIPKGDRVNTLLDMSTQLGMTDFIPLNTKRSVVSVNEKKIDRYKRVCISACKQSRRVFVPQISPPVELTMLLKQFQDTTTQIILADPGGQSLSSSDISTSAERLLLLVGPEGGFCETELTCMDQNNVIKLKLSEAILRIETACISLLSQINYRQMYEKQLL